ncbi:MAG TPA: hypothetical protein VGM18_15170 [Candidatus Sulfotelmatobacter sp.]|jgi:hypothetical protein
MLYVLRLTSGDCIVTAARNEVNAREQASSLGLEAGESVASARPMSRFALRLSPTDNGSLEVNSWDDSTLDDILMNEYPLLNKAFRTANSVRFMPSPNSQKPLLEQLRDAHEQNLEIIRKGLHQELERLVQESAVSARKAARK